MATYRVYGNSIGPNNGDYTLSTHRTLRGAARAADKANRQDCFDGENLKWHVACKIHNGPPTEEEYCRMGLYQEDGDTWESVDYFDMYKVVPAPGGFGAALKV